MLSSCLSGSSSLPLFLSLPLNEAADIPDLLSQLLQDLFFVTNLQQLESRGMHVNFVCVIWWQVRLNQAPSGWMRGAQGNSIWGAEWWTGSGQGGRHKALFVRINVLYSNSGRHTNISSRPTPALLRLYPSMFKLQRAYRNWTFLLTLCKHMEMFIQGEIFKGEFHMHNKQLREVLFLHAQGLL